MKHFALLLLGLVLAACHAGDEADAYGNFDATETTVSAQTPGRLVRLDVTEGDRLTEGQVVGLVDTVQLALQRATLAAQRRSLLAQEHATSSQGSEAHAQAQAIAAQLRTAREELARTERLYADAAATARELNQRQGEAAALAAQLQQAQARGGTIGAQAASVGTQTGQIDAQIALLDDQMRRARLENPTAGTVLTVFARRGEVVQPGVPLYTVARLDTLTLRAYVTGAQLAALRLGQSVAVRFDGADATRTGRVSWIAARAEFTPNTIQTRDNRADLVYAFDVRVPNPDGALKIGMPGEVFFAASPR